MDINQKAHAPSNEKAAGNHDPLYTASEPRRTRSQVLSVYERGMFGTTYRIGEMRACAGATLAPENTDIIRTQPRKNVVTPQAHASLLLNAVRTFPDIARVGIMSTFQVSTSSNNRVASYLVELGRQLVQPSSHIWCGVHG